MRQGQRTKRLSEGPRRTTNCFLKMFALSNCKFGRIQVVLVVFHSVFHFNSGQSTFLSKIESFETKTKYFESEKLLVGRGRSRKVQEHFGSFQNSVKTDEIELNSSYQFEINENA